MVRAFQRFFNTTAAGGATLLLAAAAAIALANSPWADAYQAFWKTPATISVGDFALSLTLQKWVNDLLMTVFFLLVGLEIKRELLVGELSSPRDAALPIAGALGGIVFPAAIYVLINPSGMEARGWAIPMATDIAFALGTLALLAPNITIGAKVFLVALAIVDDLAAVLVIAFFYTETVAWAAIGWAGAALALLIVFNRLRIRWLTPYFVVGCVLWFFVHESGVHATIAGVLVAMTIPRATRMNTHEFSSHTRALLDEFDRHESGDLVVLTSKGQQEALFAIERASERVTAPLLRLEHFIEGLSAFAIMPIFALANAGVTLSTSMPEPSITLGAALGLLIGKPVGITLAAWMAVRLGWSALPRGVNWLMLHACAWLAGIGFTMSLFIATLAFPDPALLDGAKTGILGGSLVAAIGGALVLRRAMR